MINYKAMYVKEDTKIETIARYICSRIYANKRI